MRYVAALSSIALLAILGQVFIQLALVRQSTDARVVNIAGRQRMLSQKLSKAALAVLVATDRKTRDGYAEELRSAAILWERSHLDLRRGDATPGLPGTSSATVDRMLDKVRPRHESMLGAAQRLAAAVDRNGAAEEIEPLARRILAEEAAFLKDMDLIVFQYDREARARVDRLRWIEWALFALTLIVLLLEGLYVFRPAVRRIRRTIAELERAKEALKKSEASLEERLRIVVSSAPIVLFALDREGAYTLLAGKGMASAGLEPSDVVGRSVFEIYRDEPQILEHARRALAGDLFTAVAEVEGVVFETRYSPLRDPNGEIAGVIGVATDITERTQAERARQGSEVRFRSVVQCTSDAIVLADSEGKVVSWNEGAQAMFGHSEEEVLGRDLAFLMPERYRDLHRKGLERYRSTGDPHVIGTTVELCGLRKDGREFPLELSLATWKTAEGAFYGGILRDITARKQTEERLKAAKETAEVANRAKSQFLANMSHEIRTPMNGVIGMTGLLLDTDLSPEQREYAETVHTCGDALLALINQILDFSKIEAGKLELEILDFDLRQVAEEVVEMVAGQAQQKGIELACSLDPDLPVGVRGDPARLRQILLNLIGNAVKFTEEGEVVVRVGHAGEESGGIRVRFEVTDTGIGIPPEGKARLFRAFSQADSSTTRKHGGSGLGLVISKRLAELMGGEIGVESVPGKGSTFWFTVRLDEAAGAVSARPQPRTDLAGMKVLVVDDNATNRRILSHQFRGWGMRSDSAEDAAAGLERLRAAAAAGDPYDLAILDMQMPGMDGLELARAIRADPCLASVRVVLLTSLGQHGLKREASEAGIAACMTKPVRQSQLFDCMAEVAGTAREKRSAPPASRSRPDAAHRSSRGRVLVAEDNTVHQRVAVRMLEKLGFRADVAADGREALEALARIPYDLVLMDCEMPEMDGFEATAAVRESEAGSDRHIPIVAMTANALQGDRERCLAAGMDDYLPKPVAPEGFRKTLHRWLPEA